MIAVSILFVLSIIFAGIYVAIAPKSSEHSHILRLRRSNRLSHNLH